MPEKKTEISIDCIMASLYFLCLPLTVITTPFGSLLKLVTIPTVAILLLRLFIGKNDLSFNYLHAVYTVYVLYTVSQLIYFRSERAVSVTQDMVLGFFTFLLITARVYNKREKELIESVWIAVGFICIIAAFTSKEVVSEVEERAVIKIFGFEEDQNQFCSYFIMPILVCVKRIVEKRKLRPLYIIMIILILYSILKTGSRGGLIGVVLGMVAYIMIGIKSAKRRLIIAALAVVVSCFVVFVIFPMLPESVTSRYSVTSVAEDKGSGRFEIWEYLIKYTFDKPERIIKGSGVISSYEILTEAPEKTFLNGVAHNHFVQIFSDQGLIGLFLFLFVMAACLIRPLGTDKMYSCAYLAVLAFAMSLSFYVFKPCLNIMMMCAMSFDGLLPQDVLENMKKNNLADQHKIQGRTGEKC